MTRRRLVTYEAVMRGLARNLSVKELAAELGVWPQCVREFTRAYGVTLRGQKHVYKGDEDRGQPGPTRCSCGVEFFPLVGGSRLCSLCLARLDDERRRARAGPNPATIET